MSTLSILPYFIIALIAVVGVLNPRFDDNLLQRIGLSLICIGATLRLMAGFHHTPSDGACIILAYGLVAYAIGTTIKLKKEGKL